MNFRQIALDQYFSKELTITPVKDKGPFLAGWNSLGENIFDQRFDKAWESASGFALVTGKASGIIALDIDIDEDTDCPVRRSVRAKLEAMLPPVFCARLGSAKRPAARFYQYQRIEQIKFPSIGVEILSGQACVLPPSNHPKGGKYEWVGRALTEIDVDDLPELPEEVLDFLKEEENKHAKKKKQDHELLTFVSGRCKSGSHNYLSRVGVAMRKQGKSREEMLDRLLELDKKHNTESDYLYFECRTRRWPRGNSLRENVELFVDEIIANHEVSENNFAAFLEMGFYSEKELKDGRIVKIPEYDHMACYFKEELRYKYSDRMAYIYDEGFYRPIFSDKVFHFIQGLTKRQVSPVHLNAFRQKIQAECYTDFDEIKQPEGMINLQNGVLCLKNREVKPHDPAHFFKYKLPHQYDPKATAPEFLAFLHRCADGDESLVNLIGEIMGYTILGGEPTAHRAFAFYGEGRNGKSTLLDVQRALLGHQNVSSVSMKNIDKPFSTVMLDGKIANIVEESPAKIDAEAFKNIVGGGTVTAAHKGKPEYDLKVNARLFFACNKMPVFNESTVAIKDRLIFIPFNRYIRKEERDMNIKKKLLAELPGILNFALDGLERFMAHGFTEAAASEAALEEYKIESDSVYRWFSDNVRFTGSSADFLQTSECYESYKRRCINDGCNAVTRHSFNKRFAACLREVIEKIDSTVSVNALRHKRRDAQRRGYLGFSLEKPCYVQ